MVVECLDAVADSFMPYVEHCEVAFGWSGIGRRCRECIGHEFGWDSKADREGKDLGDGDEAGDLIGIADGDFDAIWARSFRFDSFSRWRAFFFEGFGRGRGHLEVVDGSGGLDYADTESGDVAHADGYWADVESVSERAGDDCFVVLVGGGERAGEDGNLCVRFDETELLHQTGIADDGGTAERVIFVEA